MVTTAIGHIYTVYAYGEDSLVLCGEETRDLQITRVREPSLHMLGGDMIQSVIKKHIRKCRFITCEGFVEVYTMVGESMLS